MAKSKRGLRWALLGSGVLASASLVVALSGSPVAVAQEEPAETPQTTQEYELRWNNGYCLGCHSDPSLELTLPSGETLSLYVDAQTYEESVHGDLGLSCVLCHSDISEYPHAPIGAENAREFTVKSYAYCTTCHDEQYSASHDNVHARALANGNIEAPVCADCHGDHGIHTPGRRATAIQDTCQYCHATIYDRYANSVHGAALFEEDNEDVPTCTDCHGVHDVSGPHVQGFHLFSPQLCADCHADEELMGRYDISTDVFDSYVADFHGSTVIIFEELFPDQETNKPVCVDCHGVHNIASAADPESQTFRENLLATCQRCHPDATSNFPTSWLSHYTPSLEQAPLVFFVEIFYRILIPAGIGLMALWVVLDFVKMRTDRKRQASHA